MDQLYLIELLVDKIKYAYSGQELPQKNEIKISVTFGDVANMEIEPESLRKEYVEKIDPFKPDLTIDSGKSYLFPCKAENLLKAMNQSPINVSLIKQNEELLIGNVTIPWTPEFIDLVDRSKFTPPDSIPPANVQGVYQIDNEDGQNIGEMTLFLKLTCLGSNIQTQFQVVEQKAILKETPPKKFLFKSANAETTFQAQRYGEEGKSSEMLPVSPLYNPSNPQWQPKVPLSPAEMTAEKINEVLCKNRDCPGVQKFKEFGLGPAATGKGLGTIYGPTDSPISYGMSHTYGNLENYGPYGIYTRPKRLDEPFVPREPLEVEVCHCGSVSGTSIEYVQEGCQCCCTPKKPQNQSGCGSSPKNTCCSGPLRLNGGAPEEDEDKVAESSIMWEDLMQTFDKLLSEYKKAIGLFVTNDEIRGNNKHYGCYEDPLRLNERASGENEKEDVPVIVSKDLMQSFDKVLSEYKRAMALFVSNRKVSDNIQTGRYYEGPLRLNGGAPGEFENKVPEPITMCQNLMQSFDKVLSEYKKVVGTRGNTCPSRPLRLLGGSPGEDENKVPEPMVMCKDLMQSFDKVLSEYKKAIGPCGQVVCPFAPNIVAECCKKACQKAECNSPNPSERKSSAGPINTGLVSACGTPNCPYSRQSTSATDKSFQQKQMKSACGSPMCPYTREKLGTATDQEILEVHLMDGPAVARSCGSPKCPFPLKPSLPPLEPIHWDCPDPLPKGPCRNPQCPLKPPELRYNIIPRGPCGSSQCPYATPPNCGDPNCPFGPPQPCPYAQPSCPPPTCEPDCGGPCCMPPCTPPSCPGSPCSPPPCPGLPCPPPPCSPSPCGCICGNPGCPSNPPTCGDPYCPLNPPPLPCPGRKPPCPPPPCSPPPCIPPPTPCGNPTCPFAPPSPSPCGNPSCPFAPAQSSPCGDPSCPFGTPVPPSSSPCNNPSCPFAPSASSPCGDPTCPFAAPPAPASPCGNPECPFVTKKESPCYIPPQSRDNNVCANPACPYAPKEPSISLCENPECPYAPKQETFSGSGDICGNPECPYATKKPSPCFIPPKDSICSNPNCPFANPMHMEVGGTKVTVGYDRRETLTQHVTEDDGEVEYTSGDRDVGADLQPCSPRTCMAGDGDLECAECKAEKGDGENIIPEERISADKGRKGSKSSPAIGQKPRKEVKRSSNSEKAITKGAGGKKQKSKFVYKLGDLYPGVQIGHRECIIPGRNVPAKMGWLWNVHVPCVGLKPRRGWRPGAVGRTIARRIMAHRKKMGCKLLEPLEPKSSKKKFQSKYSAYESDSDVTVAPKPTLLIKKREGCYFITMNPLKDPKTIEENENPYMDCTPLQFKITKKPKEEEEKTCFCGGEEEEKSSDSELDIEFTPPAGVIRPERLKRKKNVVHTDTQYDPADFTSKNKKAKDKGKKGKGGKGGKGKKGKKK